MARREQTDSRRRLGGGLSMVRHPSASGAMSPADQAVLWRGLRRHGRAAPYRCGRCGRKLKPIDDDGKFIFECHPKKCRFRRVMNAERLAEMTNRAFNAGVTEVVID
jgi:hypothetical protein